MIDSTRSTLTAADVMTANPRTCSAFSSVLEASVLFQDEDCGAVPVVDGGRPVGILTDRDVALAVANNPELGSRPVSEFMNKDLVTVAPDAPLEGVVTTFGEQGLHRLLVVDDAGQLRGIIAWSDLAPHVSDRSLGHLVSEVIERD
jgi:CBS domain-containing protein